jgi:NAD(P)-dependent dehydrogenase (short-subunit alcohol dehydrogenase family)
MGRYRARPADGVAWVTGASAGIGRATARELARRGWTVAGSARSTEALAALADEANGPGRVVGHPCDVTDREAVERAVAAIELAHGPIALAFLDAGVAPRTGGAFRAEAFDEAFAVNLFGIVNALAALLPRMAARSRGQIALMASLAGYAGLPGAAAYGASKAAAIHLAEALRFDAAHVGVTVQLVDPGFVAGAGPRASDAARPFEVGEDEAARRIANGFATAGFEIAFPKRLAWPVKLARILPYALYFPLVARLMGGGRRG